MRILVHTPKCRVNLILPTLLALNPASASLVARLLREEDELPVMAKQVSDLFVLIRAEKKRHPDWVSVEVKTKDVHIVIRA